MSANPMKAADALLAAKALDEQQHREVRIGVQAQRERSEEVIISLALMSEADLLKTLATVYRTRFISSEKLEKATIPRPTLEMIPRKVAETYQVVPVLFDAAKGLLSVVMADPDDAALKEELLLVSGASEIHAFLTRPTAIAALIGKHHGGDASAFDRFARERFAGAGQNAGAAAPPGFGATASRVDARPAARPIAAPAERLTPATAAAAKRAPFGAATSANMLLEMPPAPAESTLAALKATQTGSHATPLAQPPVSPQLAAQAAALRTPPVLATPDHAQEAYGALRPRASSHVGLGSTEPTMELVNVLVALLENARPDLRGHSALVARISRKIAERMGLDAVETSNIVMAAHLHDLGKMGSFHFTALNCADYEGHRSAAMVAVETPLRLLESVRLAEATKRAVSEMYEQFGGGGFPRGLAGKEISLGARILAAADTYADLARNPRNPFRKVLAAEEAMAALLRYREKVYDPNVLEVMGRILGNAKAESAFGTRQRVLLVEPDPEEATILELHLSDAGLDVHIARNMVQGRELLAASEFELVVAEVTLPDGDGIELLAETRGLSGGESLGWVVYTSSNSQQKAQKAFGLGALDFVSKPIAVGVLVAKLRAMIDQRSRKRQGGVAGSLAEMGLPEIVQAVLQGRKSGRLSIVRGADRGEVLFLEGAIADASCGALRGEEAFYALLKLKTGEFSLDPSSVPTARIISESPEMLLLEGMRRIDENLV